MYVAVIEDEGNKFCRGCVIYFYVYSKGKSDDPSINGDAINNQLLINFVPHFNYKCYKLAFGLRKRGSFIIFV